MNDRVTNDGNRMLSCWKNCLLLKGICLGLALWGGFVNSVAADLGNGDFQISAGGDPGFGWIVSGDVTVAGGVATIAEDGVHLPVSLSQEFLLEGDVVKLHVQLEGLTLAANAGGQPQDAFQMSLLDSGGDSVVPVTGQGETEAFFSVQQDGTVYQGSGVSVPGAGASSTAWTPELPAVITVDVSFLTSDVTVDLALDLLGFDAVGSSVSISRVWLEGLEPVTQPDFKSTDEDTAVEIDVLANDAPASGQQLDPSSVEIAVQPMHGTLQVDDQTGGVTYDPALDYAGSDSFQYTVADLAGHQSEATEVTLTVTAVNDAPTIQGPAPVSAAKETATSIPDLSFADVDLAGGNLTVVLFVARGTLVLAEDVGGGLVGSQITGNGSAEVTVVAPLIALNATLADASGLQYTGLLNLVGADSLDIEASDGGQLGAGGTKTTMASVGISVTGDAWDVWRNQHFTVAELTHPAKEAAVWGDAADPDSDEQDNGFEFVAGTDPTEVASFFKFQVLGPTGTAGEFRVQFAPAIAGRQYEVQSVSVLDQAFTALTDSSAQDDGSTRTVTDHAAGSGMRFYRVKISLP